MTPKCWKAGASQCAVSLKEPVEEGTVGGGQTGAVRTDMPLGFEKFVNSNGGVAKK